MPSVHYQCTALLGLLVSTGAALADPSPNIEIDSFEFLPAFNGQGAVQVLAVNNKGDFCGHRGGLPPQDFRFINNTPMLGSFGMTYGDINDSGVCIGNSFQIFPPFGVRTDGFNTTFSTNRGFNSINNKGWIVGIIHQSQGAEPRIRIDDLGETIISGGAYWTHIDDEGRIWGTSFSGDNERAIMRTRFGDEQDLGSFGAAGVKLLCVNQKGDFGGLTYEATGEAPTVAFAVVDGVEHFIPTQTGNNAQTLAITPDGQIIGTDRGLCSPECDGMLWVVKNGVRHNIDNEISAFLGFFPTIWNASAASETGWIIGQATDPRDNSFHFYRMKIRVDIDTDGDGLMDFWESENGGIDINQDNVIDFKPYDFGARPDHKDLFVEVDAGTIPLGDNEVSKVVFAFDNAPVDNPDGTTGIRLHIQRDETNLPLPAAEIAASGQFPLGFASTKEQRFGTPDERADANAANILHAKAMVYRYCLLYDGLQSLGNASRYNGIGEIGGNDFAVDYAAPSFNDGFRDEDDRAATFMHELGHTLGLHHGGKPDDVLGNSMQGKVNYPSIMNYALAHPARWNTRFWTLDYCREELAPVFEAFVSESSGVSSSLYRNYSMPYGVGSPGNRSFRLARLDGRRVDFNASGTISGSVVADLNFLGANSPIVGTTAPTPDQIMKGHNDWKNIQYKVVIDSRQSAHDITNADGCPSSESVAYLEANILPPCDADFNGDGLVEDSDFQFFVLAYNELLCEEDPGGGGPAARTSEPDCPCDLNGDRFVDDSDFVLFVASYNELLCP